MGMKVERQVIEHYGLGDLSERILAALDQSGVDPERATPEELAPIDEFHIGGRPATIHFASMLSLPAGGRVLDVGCGIGGAARYFAEHFDCHVTGIDLTPEYIDIARTLSERTQTQHRVAFETASALDMPFESGSFDAAYTIHVAMNIEDRAGLYREVARVLRPGAVFGSYDVMRGDAEGLAYPLPWATTEESNHLTSPDEMRTLVGEAGFEVMEFSDRRAFGIEFFHRVRARIAEGGLPPLGVHILMGETFRDKMAHVVDGLEKGCVLPAVMIARKTG
jgi:SAM-dependent methyltransferase